MLTIEGESFPNRVAASLYGSFETSDNASHYSDPENMSGDVAARIPPDHTLSDLLVSHSLKEFEDLAVRLISSRDTLRKLKNELTWKVQHSAGIFDSSQHSFNFMHGMESIAEMKDHYPDAKQQELPHVIFTNRIMLNFSSDTTYVGL